MPQPIPDLARDQQCHHYQAPTGQRCGSPALKGEYYCYYHQVKQTNRKNQRVLIDPELTRMDLPVIEDRASIFVALAAVIHRLADNTIDTRRAGQMIYALQTALQALPPEPRATTQPAPAARAVQAASTAPSICHPDRSERPASVSLCSSELVPHSCSPTEPQHLTEPASPNAPANPPKQISITKESLLYFLRSRHCAHCNAELFPPHELTERPHPGAPPEIIEEARPTLPGPQHPSTSSTLQATANTHPVPLHPLYFPQQQSSH